LFFRCFFHKNPQGDTALSTSALKQNHHTRKWQEKKSPARAGGKSAKYEVFCETCSITNRIIEQVQYLFGK
jgi:hypothetical protein